MASQLFMKSNGVCPTAFQPTMKPEFKYNFVYVYVCYYCGDEFNSRELLQGHQSDCSMLPPSEHFQLSAVPEEAGFPKIEASSSQPSGKGFDTPKKELASSETTAGVIKRPLSPPRTPTRVAADSPCCKVSKPKFLSGLNLLPLKKARRFSERRQSTQCENIDLDDDVVLSPTQPRTPKLLLSHLSREESSVTVEQSQARRRSLFSQLSKVDQEAENGTAKEDSDEKEDKSENKSHEKLKNVKSLFNIPVTSLLGQCVMKHFKGDPNLHILTDIESHCLTELPKKKEETIRLRVRHITYPITFRGYTRNKDFYHFHKYNFTTKDRKEFLRRVRTGLDRKSRFLLRAMKRCKVQLIPLTKADLKLWMPSQNHITVDLQPLTSEEILYWMSPKPVPVPNTPAVFPSGLSLSSPNFTKILGLRTRPDKTQGCTHPSCQLSVSHFVSEEAAAEVTQYRGEVLKSLLTDLISKGEVSAPLLPRETFPGQSHQQDCYSTLRRLLSGPSSEASIEAHTLPDITNLDLTTAGHLGRSLRTSLENKPGAKVGLKRMVEDGGSKSSSENISKPQAKSRKQKLYTEIPMPLRYSPRLASQKSTWVRLATEGSEIIRHGHQPSSSATGVVGGHEVFLADKSCASSSSPSASSNRNLDSVSSNPKSPKSSVGRKLRSRPLEAGESSSNLVGEPSASAPSNSTVHQTKQRQNIRLEPTSEVHTNPSDASSGSSQLNDPKQGCLRPVSAPCTANGAVADPKLKRRLLNAGLVWRASSSEVSQGGQNESNNRTVASLGKISSPDKRNASETSIPVPSLHLGGSSSKNILNTTPSALKRGKSPLISSGSHSNLKTLLSRVTPAIQQKQSESRRKPTDWSKDTNGSAVPRPTKPGSSHLPSRDKQGRFLSVSSPTRLHRSPSKSEGAGGTPASSRNLFTAISPLVSQVSTPTLNGLHKSPCKSSGASLASPHTSLFTSMSPEVKAGRAPVLFISRRKIDRHLKSTKSLS